MSDERRPNFIGFENEEPAAAPKARSWGRGIQLSCDLPLIRLAGGCRFDVGISQMDTWL